MCFDLCLMVIGQWVRFRVSKSTSTIPFTFGPVERENTLASLYKRDKTIVDTRDNGLLKE